MNRERHAPGVYIIKSNSAVGGDLIIDNKSVPLLGTNETATLYVKNFASFVEGKLQIRFIAENLDGLSGRGTF